MALNVVKDHKNKALQATVLYCNEDAYTTVYYWSLLNYNAQRKK